jgi:predicted TIM-barrel fold metal-dependent hydrolase
VLEKAETYLWVSWVSLAEPVSLEPERVFAEHPAIVTFDSWETPVGRLPELFGAKAAWGSRYPHHDASEPAEAIAMLDRYGVAPAVKEQVMGANAAALFGLDASAGAIAGAASGAASGAPSGALVSP